MSTPAQISKAALLELFAGVRMAILHGHFTEALAHKMAEETGTTVAARARSGKSFTFQGNDGDQVGLSLVMLADALDNETDNRNIRGNYFLLLRRQVVCTGTELILDYCEKSKQTAKLAHATWWNFARLFRHTFSHGDGSTLREWPKKFRDKGITEVTWNKRKVCQADLGATPDLSMVEALRLQEEMYNFVRDELT